MNIKEHETQVATFAGGCFWCMVKPFDELPGIRAIVSGYTGGHTENPTYAEVGTETTGHYEAVQITYQPAIFPYARLLDIYWQLIDPTDNGGQFQDRGHSYRAAIFVHNEEQRQQAEESKRALQKSGRFKKKIVTEILDAGPFYPAEDEHQDYYKTHRRNYNLYVDGSGREAFAERSWNDGKDKAQLKSQLTDLQYKVTQLNEDEPPNRSGSGDWQQRRTGIYVDIINGDALFSTLDQFDNGTGWPAFAKPIEEGMVRKEADYGGGEVRTLLRSRLSKAYLGRFLQDGPAGTPPYYRVNAAALRFVPLEELAQGGYARFEALFKDEEARECNSGKPNE
ncbi:peptide-methionine (S)-S-oxide reductase MsrA [Paenibacillus sacheonensis]|uniref:Peptide methionine sulfoxide reductase MsrA n=1 Tax=Paenibacillus sacheonensis TaxID=742054 RepID=A0A7X5BVD8_9BACL|nr:peptide-methionine (S)-S-oxide reductase MsrA [Paenibacillus sacheonensis]NBC68298.1 peptide-methionine (S)-S-oxide reductase MsrA [Paenibacillus sacheonensis]